MVFRLEEAVAAVAAPAADAPGARGRVGVAVFEGSRFLLFASGALLVVLVERCDPRAAQLPRHLPRFELRQVWNVHAPIRSVRFNHTPKVARGAVALCIDEGRGVLLMPSSAAVSALAARQPAANQQKQAGAAEDGVAAGISATQRDAPYDYVKAHLHVQLPTWKESVRWKCDDRQLNELQWVERGEDLLLVGAGEKITIWKVVDDAVQVYLQHSFSIGQDAPYASIGHFDVAENGLLVATAGAHDRMVKLWVLNQLTPREGSPMRLYLPHTRALVALKWSKGVHTFKNVAPRDSVTAKCEMLFTLDKSGLVSIWRENLTQKRSFALWKTFDSQDFLQPGLDATGPAGQTQTETDCKLASFGLVNNYWTRQPDPVLESFGDLVLGESHMLSALCLFHYGHGTFAEARHNALYNQRMDGSAKMNSKLLGQRSGGIADTHMGESFICGNLFLDKAFSVNLLYGVHESGDLSLFRAEFVSFTGSSPRISLLVTCSQLRRELAGAIIHQITSTDYKDCEGGSSEFVVLITFQRTKGSTSLKVARIRFQANRGLSPASPATRTPIFSVQECEVGDACSSILNAPITTRSSSQTLHAPGTFQDATGAGSKARPVIFQGEIGVATDSFDLFRVSPSLRKAHVVRQVDNVSVEPSSTLNAYDKDARLVYEFSRNTLRGYKIQDIVANPEMRPSGINAGGVEEDSLRADMPEVSMILCCTDTLDSDEAEDNLEKLISVGIPESIKKEWSSAGSLFMQTTPVHSDFSMVIGIRAEGKELDIWVFKIAPTTPAGAPSDGVELFRKAVIRNDGARFQSISDVPFLQPFQMTFAAVDADLTLGLWTFADIDDPGRIQCTHQIDLRKLLAESAQPTQEQENMEFHTVLQSFNYKLFTISACGRAAVLVESDDSTSPASTTDSAKLCIISVVDTALEAVVPIPLKQFGEVISLEWTPFVTPERDCALLFVTSTSIGMLKFDCQRLTERWAISWTSSRFDARLQGAASLSNYPYTWVSVGPSFTRINLHDLDGINLAASSLSPSGLTPLSDTPLESKHLPAYHPIVLLYLLGRGCFRTLESVLEKVKEHVTIHEQTCYLRMLDDAQLKFLPPIALSKVLGHPEDKDERSEVFLKGKSVTGGGIGRSSGSSTSAPARASDLFGDFGMHRRPQHSSTSSSGMDRADMLFAPRPAPGVSSPDISSSDEVKVAPELSAIEREVFVKFFEAHRDSLSFLNPAESRIFLNIISGMKRVVLWERDSSRMKDEAALRFFTSLLWPLEEEERKLQNPTKTSDADEHSSGDALSPSNSVSTETAVVGGICSEQVVWAAISDYQNELLQECFPEGKLTWKQMQQLRIPFWVRSAAKLISFTEKVAQAEFAATRDPFGVAIFYVLLGKTKLLASLFKMANQSRIFELLSNDFSDLRWKNAAIKNAYVLKAKQRYALSAAFFVLGGKIQEAVAVAEHEDKTLVLSFLIARVYEKWDFVGSAGSGYDSTSDFSFSGLSSSLRGMGGGASFVGSSESTEPTQVCVDFLNANVWSRAERYADIYLQFLVRYLVGETVNAVECLLTLPKGEMRCGLSEDGTMTQIPAVYWRMFGQTLLGASSIVRFLRKTMSPIKAATKERIIKLNAVALNRMHGMGFTLAALLQQRDVSDLFQELSKTNPFSPAANDLLGCRLQLLTSAVGRQIDYAYSAFINGTKKQLLSSSPVLVESDFEDRVDETIETAMAHSGKYRVESRPETHNDFLEAVMKQATVDSLKYSGRLAALDFLVVRWNAAEISRVGHTLASSLPPLQSPVPQVVDFIIEGITNVASGDIVSSSTDQIHTRKVDQVCSELLSCASRLIIWLFCFHAKPVQDRNAMESANYVRIAVAAVYSVICVCCRYIRCPSCLYRVCAVVFPHKPPLAKKADDRLKAIASADVCVHCSSARPLRAPTTAKAPLLQDDLPVLFQVVQMLQSELLNFVADVKTNRLQLSSADPFAPFSYCPYWTMLLVAACNAMPSHVSKIAALDSLGRQHSAVKIASQKLVETWWIYNVKISKFAVKHLLCELAGLYFSPFIVKQASAGANIGESAKPGASHSPVRRAKSSDSAPPSSSEPSKTGTPPMSPTRASSSPQKRDNSSNRQLLKCSCDDCPWLLVLNLFAEKDELLLRLSGQFDACNETINNEIKWGRLPEIPSRKAPLTRSQKIMLTNVAGTNSAAGARASDISDLLQKRTHSPLSTAVSAQSVYRSETNIKGICFNRTADSPEVVYCSSKGICRTASVDYSDGNTSLPVTQRKTRADNNQLMQSGSSDDMLPPPVPTRVNGTLVGQASPSPLEGKASSFKPTTVESHPFLPLFVSGNHKGQVHLWSFDSLTAISPFRVKEVVASYPSSPSMSNKRDIKSIRFDNIGQQLGAVDHLGHLFLWQFGSLDHASYYRDIECHDKGAKGLAFINSGSSIATVGVSTEKRSVCVWDTLLPTSKALVAAPICHPAGASAVVFSPTHQLLISGGEGGSISAFDMRQRRVLHNISNAHETAIKTLALHPSGECLLSGSASGDVKIWSLPIFREVASLYKLHSKQSFLGDAASNILGDAASNMAINVTNLSWGVTDSIATEEYFFTSGTDGSVQRIKVPSLSKMM